MHPFLPADIFTGAAETACYVCAVIMAVVSYFMTCRF
jgi:hypothetical protein